MKKNLHGNLKFDKGFWAKSMCFWVDFARNVCETGEIDAFLGRFRPIR